MYVDQAEAGEVERGGGRGICKRWAEAGGSCKERGTRRTLHGVVRRRRSPTEAARKQRQLSAAEGFGFFRFFGDLTS